MKRFLLACPIYLLLIIGCSPTDSYKNWSTYGGGTDNTHYSTLTSIDTSNVTGLQVAWIYHSGDLDTANHSQIQCNPLMIDGTLYGTSAMMKLFAIDAATGKEKWSFNPFDSLSGDRRMFFILNNCRGISYWNAGPGRGYIYYTAGSYLYCIDATNGRPESSFGSNGRVDLHEGLDRNLEDRFITATAPGVVFRDLLIMGSRVAEAANAAPGHIRAFDLRTGEVKWIFHTIPYPGETGYDTWEDSAAYRHIGGANAWSGLTLDEERGIVFAPTGSASWDFYGGKRRGDNLFANTLLALDAATGKRIWHFQTIHHDLWDHDLSSPPALVTISKNGQSIPAAALTTKTGYVFIFDRNTGKPVYPIEERPVPTSSELAGEYLSPTQPHVDIPKPFVRQLITENDLNKLLPDSSYEDVRNRFRSYKKSSMFEPLSKEGTIVVPGLDGGAEWGGPSYDPESGWLYVNANEMVNVLQMVDLSSKTENNETVEMAGKRLYQANCMSCHGPNRKGGGNYPSLEHIEQRLDAEQTIALISAGRRMMPAFTQLTNVEKEAVAAYVRSDRHLLQRTYKGPKAAVDPYLNLPYTVTGYNLFLSKEGLPAISPPWGTLTAIDLNSGDFVWRDTLGDYPYYEEKGIHTGSENYGGSIITKGGLLFIAGTRDGHLRAYNKRTGKLLWSYKLPAAAFATPATYAINGKQFLVIACGGGKMKTTSSDIYIAFALPD